MNDLRNGVWSELSRGQKIDTYRRNLQRAHVDRLGYLLTVEKQQPGRAGWLFKIHYCKRKSV